MTPLANHLQTRLALGECFLTEAAVVERMRREFRIPPDEHLVYGGAIYDKHSREVLSSIYHSYIDIARRAAMPILLTSSTRRANRDRIAASRYAHCDVNQDWITFLKDIRGDAVDSVLVGTLLGTQGNAYRPQEALSEKEALAFHRSQCQACLEGDADFLMAGVLPALSEAIGIARAMGETGRPFIVSFIVNRDGTLLDGTPLGVAMESIDNVCPPLCYMVNCVHPNNVRAGLLVEVNRNHPSLPRLVGIQANTSTLSPEELDNSDDLKCDEADSLAESMLALRRDHAFQIFGGCCGTDNRHLESIAMRLSMKPYSPIAHSRTFPSRA
jgi:S-methylmethionine-dependent homocysteine/selenocysteine methylase